MENGTLLRVGGALFLAAAFAVGCESKETKSSTSATAPAAAGDAAPSAATPAGATAGPSESAAAPTSAPSAQMTATEAQTKLDQVTQYIKDNKLDLAEKSLKQLEDNKAQLPVTVADKLPQVRSALNAAKAGGTVKDAAGGLKLP